MSLRRRVVPLLLAALAAVPAGVPAEIVDAGENGFTVRYTATVPVAPARAYAALTEIGKWWHPEHTWSGDAANLSIDAKPQGCFCERLPGGGVRHLTVVYAAPGKLLRLEGGLGPLQGMGVTGIMTWTFRPAEKGTSIEMQYVVGGYRPGGFKDLAPGVDPVLGMQFGRFKRYVETGKP